MRVVQINSVCGIGSTGGITIQLSRTMTENNIENYILYSYNKYDYSQGIRYSNKHKIKFNALFSHLFGNYGFNSKSATKKLIRHLEKINPDIVHIHNIHGHDLHLEMLFRYLEKKGTRVIFTLHDCWLFTGYCVHFDNIGCNKWQTQCADCPQRKQYSWFFDKSQKLYNRKKKNCLRHFRM